MAITFPTTGLAGLQGRDNVSGIVPLLYAAPLDSFLSLATTIGTFDSNTEISETVRIAGPHTFKTGECFRPVYSTTGTGKIDFETSEEFDTSGGYTTLTFQHPGSTVDAAGFFRWSKNNQWVIMTKLPDGKYRQIGTQDYPAQFMSSHTTGELGGDRNAFTCTVKAYTLGILLYEGVVSTTPAV